MDVSTKIKRYWVTEVIEIDELLLGIYPNPSNGLIKVNIPRTDINEYKINIYDLMGKNN